MLIVSNDHLSASRAGLQQRANNRKEAINKLSSMLELTEEDVEESYWRRING
jgi:hypothetical protein